MLLWIVGDRDLWTSTLQWVADFDTNLCKPFCLPRHRAWLGVCFTTRNRCVAPGHLLFQKQFEKLTSRARRSEGADLDSVAILPHWCESKDQVEGTWRSQQSWQRQPAQPGSTVELVPVNHSTLPWWRGQLSKFGQTWLSAELWDYLEFCSVSHWIDRCWQSAEANATAKICFGWKRSLKDTEHHVATAMSSIHSFLTLPHVDRCKSCPRSIYI